MIQQKFKDKQAILKAMRTPFLEPKSSIKKSLNTTIQNFEEHFADLGSNGYIEKKVSDKANNLVLYIISEKGQAALANDEFIEKGETVELEKKMKKTQIINWKISMAIGVIGLIISFIVVYCKSCK